jgi:phage recombination protein Bet
MTPQQIKLLELNKIIPQGCPQAQIDFFAAVCEKKKLDPMLRQIHLVERKSKDNFGKWVASYTIQAGIDGMRVIAQRNCKIKSYKRWTEKRENLLYGICEIQTEDRGTYYDELPYSEYVQTKSDGTPNHFWKQMPETMIKKCAEESVLRMMAPEDLSGVYGDDEMLQADSEVKEVKQIDKGNGKQIETVAVDPIINEDINAEAREMFKPESDELTLSINQAKSVQELNKIYSSIPEDKKAEYLTKLSTRKAILRANKDLPKEVKNV